MIGRLLGSGYQLAVYKYIFNLFSLAAEIRIDDRLALRRHNIAPEYQAILPDFHLLCVRVFELFLFHMQIVVNDALNICVFKATDHILLPVQIHDRFDLVKSQIDYPVRSLRDRGGQRFVIQ